MNKMVVAAIGALIVVGGAVAARELIGPDPMAPARAIAEHVIGAGFYVLVVQANADPASFEDLAALKCLDHDRCMVGIWKQGDEPAFLPFTEQQIKAQRFAYTINRETGFKRAAWDCSLYPNTPRADCIAKAD